MSSFRTNLAVVAFLSCVCILTYIYYLARPTSTFNPVPQEEIRYRLGSQRLKEEEQRLQEERKKLEELRQSIEAELAGDKTNPSKIDAELKSLSQMLQKLEGDKSQGSQVEELRKQVEQLQREKLEATKNQKQQQETLQREKEKLQAELEELKNKMATLETQKQNKPGSDHLLVDDADDSLNMEPVLRIEQPGFEKYYLSSDPTAPTLMPLPESMELDKTGKFFFIDYDFEVAIASKHDGDDIVPNAANTLFQRLDKMLHVKAFSSKKVTYGSPTSHALVIKYEKPLTELTLKMDESYQLTVTENLVTLNAGTSIGVLRGIETFLQLITRVLGERPSIPTLTIKDKPRFAWRGLMVDVARHFHPAHSIKANIDAMAAVKMNVLHLHLSDDQGFRMEVKAYPKLHTVAGEGQYYTQDELKDIVEHARLRGVRVVPEFDVPGHTSCWIYAYPEYASGSVPNGVETGWGVFIPTLDPTRDDTYNFIEGIFSEAFAIFKDDYFHIGGDEVNPQDWRSSSKIAAYMGNNHLHSTHELQLAFNKRVNDILTKHGKKMIGWDEILCPDLPKNVVIQSWRGTQPLQDGARHGFMSILSAGYYLDHMNPAGYHYDFDPNKDFTSDLIVGGEACMWSEYVSAENLHSRVWPRTAAVAEKLWSPKDKTNDKGGMYARLSATNDWLHKSVLNVSHLTAYDFMLKRLTEDSSNGVALRILANVIEPVNRVQTPSYNSKTPLHGVVDIVPAESVTARNGQLLLDQMAASTEAFQKHVDFARKVFKAWADNYKKFVDLLKDRNNLNYLQDVADFSRDLESLGNIALEGLEFLEKKTRPPESWFSKAQSAASGVGNERRKMKLVAGHIVSKMVTLARKL